MESYEKIRGLLGEHRAGGFDYIFEYLKNIQNPLIVETGCARQENNYYGDGQSSLLFDAYVHQYGGEFYTVDISPESVAYCRSKVSSATKVVQEDSIKFLKSLNTQLLAQNKKIDFLYLDSFDAPKDQPDVVVQSALHHLYELITILRSLKSGALICVDDCWMNNGMFDGKGKIILDYMSKINILPCRASYQTMWKFE